MAEFRAFRPLESQHGDLLEPLAKVLRELQNNCPWINAKRIKIDFDGSSNTADVPHGLGRAYTGGWVGDGDDVSAVRRIVTGSVAAADGLDTSIYVRVKQLGTATAETIYVWVY